MTANFNKPVTTDLYTDILTIIRDNHAALSAWDYTGVTSSDLPSSPKRWNSTSKRFEYYNGTSWVELSSEYNINALTFNGQDSSYYRNASNINAGTLGLARLPSEINPSTVSGAKFGRHTYMLDERYGYPALLISAFTNMQWTSVGPTDSGADVIWTPLDLLPSNATSVILDAYSEVTPSVSAGSQAYANVNSRLPGSTTEYPQEVSTLFSMVETFTGYKTKSFNQRIVPIDSNLIFEMYFYESGSSVSYSHAKLVGWMTK